MRRAIDYLLAWDRGPEPFDRYPFNTDWVRTWVNRCLVFWFAMFSLGQIRAYLEIPDAFGFDVRLYRLAAEAWIAGGDPWAVRLAWNADIGSFGYAGPPQTLLPFLLLSWVPEDVLVLLYALAAATTAMWVLRRLQLPLWWLAFPPIVEGIWVGNLNIFVIALLVAGGTVAGTVATTLKTYAAVPLLLLGRWRSLALAGLLALVTVPFLPWADFLRQYPEIASTLSQQAWGGRTNLLTSPIAVIGGALALVFLGRSRSNWLAVPVLWPATQLHYTVIALPAMTPFLAFFGAVPIPGMMGLGVMLLASSEGVIRFRDARQATRARASQVDASSTPLDATVALPPTSK